MEASYKAKETITGKVVDRIKGGLVVDIGVRAFLPGSQYDLRPAQNLDSLMGQELQFRITKLNRRRGNVVVSRRALMEEELHAKRDALLETLAEGQTVHGYVKNVTGVRRIRGYRRHRRLAASHGLLSWGPREASTSDIVKLPIRNSTSSSLSLTRKSSVFHLA